MNRTGFRTMSLLITSTCFLVALGGYYKTKQQWEEVGTLEGEKNRLEEEFRNVNRLSSQLDELDKLTLDERVATQLDILRHTGLAQMDLGFRIENRETRQVGGVALYVRGISIDNVMTYNGALKLIDMLQNDRKMVITGLEFRAGNNLNPENVTVQIRGQIFGLDKKGDI